MQLNHTNTPVKMTAEPTGAKEERATASSHGRQLPSSSGLEGGLAGDYSPPVSVTLFEEDSYGPSSGRCVNVPSNDPQRMHTADPCSFTPYGYDIVRTRAGISCSFVATALIGVSAALFEDSYGPFALTRCKCDCKHDTHRTHTADPCSFSRSVHPSVGKKRPPFSLVKVKRS